tara:strand:+ start:424 stop:921 length:498 start_codon:yes stop_codon:yes gene_type:complete
MASAWGKSWGYSWGNSWGIIAHKPDTQEGGGPGQSKRKRGTGWERERAIFEASLKRFDDEHMRSIARTMADSESPRANRIARKLANYNGEIEDVYRLQSEIKKLEAELNKRLNDTKAIADHENELRAASAELTLILLDEEDSISALIYIDEIESKILFSIISNRF